MTATLSAPERRLQASILANPLLTAVPTGKQQDFLALNTFMQIYSGANWVGKTSIIALKLAALAWKPATNPFLNLPHLRQFPANYRGRIITPHSLVESDLLPTLKAWFPRQRYTTSKRTRPFESLFTLDTGASFDLMTYDQSPAEFEGAKLDVAVFNEPPPYAIFTATIARMRPHGIIMIGMTPLSGAGYLFDRINNPFASQSYGVVYADIESVCLEHGTRGYLAHADIEKKIREYDPDEVEARVHGRPMHLSGLVYKSFTRRTHVVSPFRIPEDWPRWNLCDPHDRKPFALGWAALSPVGKLYIYDEWPHTPFHEQKSCSLTVKEYAALIREHEAQHPTSAPITRIIDARFGKKQSSQTGRSIRDLFDDEGLCFLDSYLEQGGLLDNGHQQVKEWLRLKADHQPSLMIFDTCRNHIYGMEHYVWDEHRHQEAGLKEKVRDVHKDFPDLIRYLVMEDPRYPAPLPADAPPPQWAQERILSGYERMN